MGRRTSKTNEAFPRWASLTTSQWENACARLGDDNFLKICEGLSQDAHSPFHGLKPEFLHQRLKDVIETPRESVPKTVNKNRETRIEGFLLHRTGDKLTHLYFCYPGAIILTSKMDMDPNDEVRTSADTGNLLLRKPKQYGDAAYLRVLHHAARYNAVVRNCQFAGLLEYTQCCECLIYPKGPLSNVEWSADVYVATRSIIYRISIEEFHQWISTDISGTAKIRGHTLPIRFGILQNLITELSHRLLEGHLDARLSYEDNGKMQLARFLFKFYNSVRPFVDEKKLEEDGGVKINGAYPRITYYTLVNEKIAGGGGVDQLMSPKNPMLTKIKNAEYVITADNFDRISKFVKRIDHEEEKEGLENR